MCSKMHVAATCGVCVGTHTSLFITACQHDQGLYILLPYHPPELADCGGQRTLSCNKFLPGVETLPNKTSAQPENTNTHPVQVSLRFSGVPDTNGDEGGIV